MINNENQGNESRNGIKERVIDLEALSAHKAPLGKPRGRDLFGRVGPTVDYVQAQRKQELWMQNRRLITGVDTEIVAMDEQNNVIHGINFASADYLGLAQNEFAREAAVQAARQFGVNSAGSPLAFGATKYYMQLKQELAEFWGVKSLLLYSAGWLAGFGVVKALVKKHDYVIMDELSHNCLVEGASAATDQVQKFKHLDQQQMFRIIKETRQKDSENGILVVTEGLFSMDCESPDLNKIQQFCKQYGAFLLIDCAHDFGCMGENGRGMWEVQNLKDRSNIVLVGTGSKSLSTNVGFVGCDDPDVIEYFKYFSTAYMFTNAINPVQAATALANLRIIRSEKGKQLRKKLMQNYSYLRDKIQSKGYKVYGNQCAIIPIHIGNQIVARLTARIMMDNGVHVNCVEFPIVKMGQARIRVNLMPQHTKQHFDQFVTVFEMCYKKSLQIFERSLKAYQQRHEKMEAKL